MADGFIPGLVSWLDDIVPMPVVMGASGKRLQPGTVTVAPSGLNLLVRDAERRRTLGSTAFTRLRHDFSMEGGIDMLEARLRAVTHAPRREPERV